MSIGYKYKSPPQPPQTRRRKTFDFFGLPGEVRNMICSLVVIQDEKPFLQDPKLPGICQASRQLQHESLPLYFELNTFIMEVAAPAVLRNVLDPTGSWQLRANFIREHDPRFRRAGALTLKPRMEATLRSNTPEIQVMNIDIVPLDFETRGVSEHLNIVLSVRKPKGKGKGDVSVHVRGSRVGFPRAATYPQLRQDLLHISSHATKYLQSYADRDDSKGLTFSGLTALARTLRVRPREGAEAQLDDLA